MMSKFSYELDSEGAATSLFVRPIRQLLEEGKPVGPMTMICVETPSGSYPIGVLAKTHGNWLVFWPLMPKRPTMPGNFDHITMALHPTQFGISHVTAYDGEGTRLHESASDYGRSQHWRLQKAPDTGAEYWLSMLVRWEIILGQELNVEKWFQAPHDAEAQRKRNEMAKHVSQMMMVDVPLPPVTHALHFLYFTLSVVTEPKKGWHPTHQSYLLFDASKHVDGWTSEDEFNAAHKRFMVGDQMIVASIACPPGQLRPDMELALASKKSTAKP